MNMNKLKINPGLAGIILLACLFSGWQTLLLVVILMLLFCEVDDKIKSVIIKVVTFFAAYTIVTMAWDLIMTGIDVVFKTIDTILNTINSFLDYTDQIDFSALKNYFLTPLSNLVGIADNVVSFLFLVVKFAFIVATIQNKPTKENIVSKKINEFVTKIVNYINGLDLGPVATAPAQAAAPTAPAEAPVPPTQTPTPTDNSNPQNNQPSTNNSNNQQ